MIPAKENLADINQYERPLATYINSCKKYLIQDRTFERQYATLYTSRLKTSTNLILKQVLNKWGPSANVKQLCDVTGCENVIVIGTIFKHMELHPSILKEISEEHNLIPQPVTDEFTNDDDYLILEDDLQRVVLCGNIEPHSHVTGINIAVKGYTEESGKFFVEDFCYTSVLNPENFPSFMEDKYVLLVSGFGVDKARPMFALQILIDLITGQLGEAQDQQKFARIVRLIIAGNSICRPQKDTFKTRFLTRKSKPHSVECMEQLDNYISQLITSVDVDLMPGEFDPANHLLPQQPLHPLMFPKSSQYSTFNVVTNPYDATIDGVRFLGSSGQNVKDIRAFSKISDTLDVMQKTLDWGHIAPTAPDTLNCYPYLDEDPFVISRYPHVYFSGNAPKMGFRFHDHHKVLMIAMPKFEDSFCAILLNLRSLHIEPIIVCDTVK